MIIVKCPGRDRPQLFETFEQAEHWAQWGHACLAPKHHEFQSLREFLRPLVEVGADLLDDEYPSWYGHVDDENLHMESTCGCVLGQVYTALVHDDINPDAMSEYFQMAHLLGLSSEQQSRFGFCDPLIALCENHINMAVMPMHVIFDESYKMLDELWKGEIDARRAPARRT